MNHSSKRANEGGNAGAYHTDAREGHPYFSGQKIMISHELVFDENRTATEEKDCGTAWNQEAEEDVTGAFLEEIKSGRIWHSIKNGPKWRYKAAGRKTAKTSERRARICP